MKKCRVGVVGVGRFGRLHLAVLKQFPECSVDAIADIDSKLVKQVSKKNGIKAAYTNALELLKSPDLDAVDIVTDEATHARFIMEALKHGKHVFVEKPLATSSRDAEEIRKLSGKTGLHVMVGNISRFSQPYVVLKRRVASGALGRLGIIRAKRDFSRSWFQYFGKRIHTVYESGIHDIDLVLWFARGRCVSVYAAERRMSGCKYPDLFTATLTFEDGLVATVTSAWLVADNGPQNLVETLELDGTIDADIEILGEKGGAKFRLAHDGLSVWTAKGVQHPDISLWPTEHDAIGGAIRAELQHFIGLVGRKAPSKVAPLSDSVYALKIADAIVRSAKEGKAIRLEGGRP